MPSTVSYLRVVDVHARQSLIHAVDRSRLGRFLGGECGKRIVLGSLLGHNRSEQRAVESYTCLLADMHSRYVRYCVFPLQLRTHQAVAILLAQAAGLAAHHSHDLTVYSSDLAAVGGRRHHMPVAALAVGDNVAAAAVVGVFVAVLVVDSRSCHVAGPAAAAALPTRPAGRDSRHSTAGTRPVRCHSRNTGHIGHRSRPCAVAGSAGDVLGRNIAAAIAVDGFRSAAWRRCRRFKPQACEWEPAVLRCRKFARSRCQRRTCS